LEIINKLQKLVLLVGFTTEIYYDTQNYERQTAYISLFCLAPRPESEKPAFAADANEVFSM
jgi:hypothetical protein